jgi:hypothetical protein
VADDVIDFPDDFEERENEFVENQGISQGDYSELLELADIHAAATATVAGAPSWRFVGPRNVGGRIVSLGQDPIDPRIIYAGAAQGGLWRSIDAGDTWERLGDDSMTFPVGAIAVAPGAPNVIYFGTGAMQPKYVSGRGLFRATIAGVTGNATIERLVRPDPPDVTPLNAKPGASLRYTRIRVDPDDPTRFWAASQTGLWRCECPLAQLTPTFIRELPDSTNNPSAAALTTQLASNGLWPSYATDLLVAHDPRETETVPLNGVEVPRYLILFVGIENVGVFRGRFDRKDSANPATFDSTPLNMPTGALSFDRVRLAQCERQPEHVFAVFADTAGNVPSEVYHSANSGNDWKQGAVRIPPLTGQANYDLVLEVAPDDPQVVICGTIELNLSRDFGNNWLKILDRRAHDRGDKAQHADQHIAMFDRGDHRRLWVGNDGGLSMARDLGSPPLSFGYWRKRSHGIYAGMCQDVSVNPGLPFMCSCGFHDNGSFLSIGGPTWYQVGGGDGGGTAFNLINAHQLFVGWQGNSANGQGLERSDAVAFDTPQPVGGSFDLVTLAAHDIPETVARGHGVRYRLTDLGLPASGVPLGNAALFAGVIEQHPTAAGSLLLGRAGDAFSSTNFGANWAPLIAGTPIAPGAGGEVLAMTFGHAEASNPVPGGVDGWAGTSGGALWFTSLAPAGVWAAAPTALPFPGAPMRISEITVHPVDRRILAVSATGVQGRVFLTYDQGHTWYDLTEPPPTSLTVVPVGASVHIGETRAFTAIANYPGVGVTNVTTRAAWSSSPAGQATVGTAGGGAPTFGSPPQFTGLGSEGHVTGVAVGAPTITATLLAPAVAPAPPIPNGSAAQPVTITPAVVPTPTNPVAPQPHDLVPGSLPPGPIGSVIFDPAPGPGAPMTLLAGTLVGVYALTNIPAIVSLAIQPGSFSVQTGAAVFQLHCVATLSDASTLDVTSSVDWSNTANGSAVVSNVAGSEGQVTFGGVGSDTITATRNGVAAVPASSITITVQAAPAGAPPAFVAPVPVRPTVAWQRYSVGLPQILISDFERVGATNVIRAATFGMGVFEIVTAGGPQQQLYIRQTIIEDGRTYPRQIPALVPDDPRFLAGAVLLDFTHSFDIRVDAPPFTFFDDVVDGVEFDEQLEVGDAVPTEDNYVYVQVLNAGPTAVPNVTVHLYAALCDATDVINPIGPVATASPASLEVAGAAPIADFYGQANRDPIAGSHWTRVDVARVLTTVRSDEPGVARFTWVPDVALAGRNVALLALCDAASDALPAAPAAATLAPFILAERRAALRVVHVGARPVAALYVRDGIADDTRVGGYPAGGRSPDIMVVHPDITGTPEDAFKDHIARRVGDTLSHGATNVIYVRVHNRRRFQTNARVKVFAIPLDDDNAAPHDTAGWTELPSAAAFADTTVPPLGVAYARVEFPTPNDPSSSGTNKAYLLLALIRSDDDTDPLPNKDRVTDPDAFWTVVSKFADSDNAAARAVHWVP